MSDKKKIVLAFSGGLDTSYCVPYLKQQYNAEIHTVLVNTGGFSPTELEQKKEDAFNLGAHSNKSIDHTEKFYEQVIRFLIFGNVLINNTYPLSVIYEW